MHRISRSTIPGILGVAVTVAMLAAFAGCGNKPDEAATTEANAPAASLSTDEFSYEPYDALVHKYVNDEGLVDYKDLQLNRGPLDQFIADIGALDPDAFAKWDDAQRMALWINAYNAITLRRIIDHYPIEKGGLIASLRFPKNSIRQIPGVWDEITNRVVGQRLTLDNIEHDILRKRFREPRIHAALVCAAMGCPPLRNEAYDAGRLDQQLDDQSRRFLGKPRRFHIDRGKNVVYLSPILSWYGKDFVGVYNQDGRVTGHGEEEDAVLAYASRYVSEADAQYILHETYNVEFLDYDWSLNEQQ